jgi:hypothetical protein
MRLRIEVVGSEKRLYEKEWKVVFAVKVQLGHPEEIYHIVYYELDELKEVELFIREIHKLQPPSLDTKLKGMSNDDLKSDFTKYFEFKSIIIEDFLNFCLRNKLICKKPEFVVFKLKIH